MLTACLSIFLHQYCLLTHDLVMCADICEKTELLTTVTQTRTLILMNLLFVSKQLFGLGVANIFGSFFSAYPTTGEIPL